MKEYVDPRDPRVLWRVAPGEGQVFGIVACLSDFLSPFLVGRFAQVIQYVGSSRWRIKLIDEEEAYLTVGGDQLLVELFKVEESLRVGSTENDEADQLPHQTKSMQ